MKELDEEHGLHGDVSTRPRGVYGRSGSTRVLLDDCISSECALSAKYERLSPSSRRSPEDASPTRQQRKVGARRLLSFVPLTGKAVDVPGRRASGYGKSSGEHGSDPPTAVKKGLDIKVSAAVPSASRDESKREEDAEDGKKTTEAAAAATATATKKKSWSSWLPDPERRWPIQGW